MTDCAWEGGLALGGRWVVPRYGEGLSHGEWCLLVVHIERTRLPIIGAISRAAEASVERNGKRAG